MKAREAVLGLSLLVAASVAAACEPVSVPPWAYTMEGADGGALDGGPANDAESTDASGLGMSDAGGIAAKYAPSPLRCDGGLCDTSNYSLCSISNGPATDRVGTAVPVLFALAGMALGRRRRRRGAGRSS